MRVEAIKQHDGILIPMNEAFRNIRYEKLLLDVQIVEPVEQDDYAILDELIGICETERSDASVHHNAIIYGKREASSIH